LALGWLVTGWRLLVIPKKNRESIMKGKIVFFPLEKWQKKKKKNT